MGLVAVWAGVLGGLRVTGLDFGLQLGLSLTLGVQFMDRVTFWG